MSFMRIPGLRMFLHTRKSINSLQMLSAFEKMMGTYVVPLLMNEYNGSFNFYTIEGIFIH